MTRREAVHTILAAVAAALVITGCTDISVLAALKNAEAKARATSVTYDPNGATSGSVPVDSAAYTEGQIVTVLGNTGKLAESLKGFGGWNTSADGSGTAYAPGQTFAMGTANVTLYAQWHNSRLLASDAAQYDDFGYSVAVSNDGSTMVVGAYNKTVSSNSSQGAAYVFTKYGNTWSKAQELTASDGAAGDYFGCRVAISGDGSTVVIGAETTTSRSYQGAAYVFTKSGGTWSQTKELAASDASTYDHFGDSVAISSDGGTIAIGAWGKSVVGKSSRGAAYVFTGSGSAWIQAPELVPSDGVGNDCFGHSIAVSSDGTTVVIGAWEKTVSLTTQGAAYVFTGSGGTWSQAQELTASDGAADDYFGGSVAVSSDGGTIVIGAQYKTVSSNSGQGAAYVFTGSGSAWSQVQELTATDGTSSDDFGISVATSSGGSAIVIGADCKTVSSNGNQGAAYVFTGSGGAWSQAQELTASDGAANVNFGTSAAISNDGGTVLIGAPYKTVSVSDQGAAYVFAKSGGSWY